MNNSKRSIAKILKHEGGYVNNKNDKGGPTNKGITIATFRRYIKPSGTIADLKALTEAQAIIVYKRQYWDRVLGDMLPSGVDYAVADYAVNSGPSRAAKALQKVVGVRQDGAIGPATLAAVGGKDPHAIINTLSSQRLGFMRGIRGGKDWRTFGKGWTRRVEEVRELAHKWASEAPSQAVPPKQQANPVAGDSGLVTAILKALSTIFGAKK